MYFKQFLDERVGCASYLIASRQTGDAAIVDPGITIWNYDQLLKERDFHLRYVIDTHVHADHVSGARELIAEHPGAQHVMYQSTNVAYPFRAVNDAEELELGQLRLRIWHTPGHRPEMMSILVINPERSPEPSMVLTGDSLLVGDVGRPDFGGGDPHDQYHSISRLLRLPDWVAVFPGHFEGPCGKGMCGRPSTTIGFERLFNPLLHLDEGPFVHELDDGVPARPLNMEDIEATNRGAEHKEWTMLKDFSEVDTDSPGEVATRPHDSMLVDVREPSEYAEGHIPGAINIPQSELSKHLDDLPKKEPLYMVCQSGSRSARAAQFLQQVGFHNVLSVEGGTNSWIEQGYPVDKSEYDGDSPRIIDSGFAHAGASAESANL